MFLRQTYFVKEKSSVETVARNNCAIGADVIRESGRLFVHGKQITNVIDICMFNDDTREFHKCSIYHGHQTDKWITTSKLNLMTFWLRMRRKTFSAQINRCASVTLGAVMFSAAMLMK